MSSRRRRIGSKDAESGSVHWLRAWRGLKAGAVRARSSGSGSLIRATREAQRFGRAGPGLLRQDAYGGRARPPPRVPARARRLDCHPAHASGSSLTAGAITLGGVRAAAPSWSPRREPRPPSLLRTSPVRPPRASRARRRPTASARKWTRRRRDPGSSHRPGGQRSVPRPATSTAIPAGPSRGTTRSRNQVSPSRFGFQSQFPKLHHRLRRGSGNGAPLSGLDPVRDHDASRPVLCTNAPRSRSEQTETASKSRAAATSQWCQRTLVRRSGGGCRTRS